MMRFLRKCRSVIPVCGLALTLVLLAGTTGLADVTIKQTAVTKGLGGFLNAEMKTETMISSDMQCVNTEVRMKNKLLGMFGGNKPIKTTQITRLDKGVVWDLMHKEKKYTEQSLSDMHEMMSGMSDQMSGMEGMEGMGDEEEGFDSADVKWSQPQFTVENTGKTDKIAGYECSQSIVKMVMEGENVKTGEKMKMVIDMDMMMARDVPGIDEQMAFGKKYAEAVGMDDVAEGMLGGGMLDALKQYGVNSDDLASEAEKLEGYPLRMVMKMSGEGGQFAQMSQGMSDEDKAEMKEAQDEASEALSKLGGLFGHKKKKKKKEEKEPEDVKMTSDDGSFMTVTTEITEISTSSIKGSNFEIPGKYKKIGGGAE